MSGLRIALLRAVNVGDRQLPMAELRAMAAELGLGEPRTLLQSGNLIFRSDAAEAAALERRLEAAVQARFGFASDVIVRTSEECAALAAQNPFPEQAAADPARLLVMFLKTAPSGESAQALKAAITGPEQAHVVGREAYVAYPEGIGISRLTNAVIEKKLGVRGTARNWNTVLKLAALAEA